MNGAYAMSKHAIEAYSDALRRELMFLGAPVIKIQPGPFRTGMVASIEQNFERVAQASTYFKELLQTLKKATIREQGKAHDPELLAEVVHTALTTRYPRISYSVKPDPQRVALSALPDWAADPLLKLALGTLALFVGALGLERRPGGGTGRDRVTWPSPASGSSSSTRSSGSVSRTRRPSSTSRPTSTC